MREIEHITTGSAVIAAKEEANPEGKGCSLLLNDWSATEPRDVVAKPRRQLLAEFFTSMLVLSANFKFRPALGVDNFLYWIDGEWSLSLIGPGEWSQERRAGFAGTCVLQRDMTWTIRPSAQLTGDSEVSNALRGFYDAFAASLDTDLTLEEILPFYVGTIPYYQRLYASALSRSMRAAVRLGDQASISCRNWFSLLPQSQTALLTHEG